MRNQHQVRQTDLAQFHSHLVIRVDPPDRTLHVNLVLVHRDQCAQCSRCELLEHDRIGRLVPLEDLGLDECGVFGFDTELLRDLRLGLSES